MYGQELTARVEQANSHYQEERFEEAIQAYQQVIEAGYHSTQLYYNLGNAYYKTDQIPSAILFYEKALKLDPSNKDAQHNLRIANLRTVDKIDPIEPLFFNKWWDRILNLCSPDNWARWSVGLLFSAVLFFGLFLFIQLRSIKKISFFSFLVVLFLGIFSWMLGIAQNNRLHNSEFAIVFTPSVTVGSAPQQNATELFVIHEGTKVKIVQETEQWVEIMLMNGKSGWIKTNDLQTI
jgi:tetratricopeptide (TPR) repeat protein